MVAPGKRDQRGDKRLRMRLGSTVTIQVGHHAQMRGDEAREK